MDESNETYNDLYYDVSKEILVKVFIHKTYENRKKRGIGDREGTYADVANINQCFQKIFQVKPKIMWDFTKKQIICILDEVANLDSSKYSCVIFIVITHGTTENLHAYDESYERSMLWEKLTGKLIGVPKLYFIQACRGDSKDLGSEVETGREVPDSVGELLEYEQIEEVQCVIPKMADFLQMHSSCHEYESYVQEEGSWFITNLCDVFYNKYQEWDILQMLTYVSNQVASRDFIVDKRGKKKKFKQISQMVTTLRKFLKFSMENE